MQKFTFLFISFCLFGFDGRSQNQAAFQSATELSGTQYLIPDYYQQKYFKIVYGIPWYKEGEQWYDFNLKENAKAGNGLYYQISNQQASCLQFIICPSNHKRAYYLLAGEKRHGLLSRGVQDYSGHWDWESGGANAGADITPVLMYNPHTGVSATAFCVDAKNENSLFLALDVDTANSPIANMVLKSVDGGNSWTDMSTGLPASKIKRLEYRNGSNETIYAYTNEGSWYWDNALQCWIKMK